jgi:hypothetical protein
MLKKILNSSWVQLLVGSLFIPLLLDFFRQKPILDTFKIILRHLANFLVLITDIEIKLYWLFIAVICLFLIKLFIRKYFKLSSKPTDLNKDFLQYRKARINNRTWRWNWDDDGSIINLEVLCSNCETPLLTEQHGLYDMVFVCPRGCKSSFVTINDLEDRIKTIIIDNVRKGDFPYK